MSQPKPTEDHFFIKYIQNKLRSYAKKLKQIEQLESQNEALNPDQEKKIQNKNEIQSSIDNYKKMLQIYQSAEKEFGIKRAEGKKQVKMEKFKEEEKVITDTISFIMELQYLSQYFAKGPISPSLQPHSLQINQIKSLYDNCFRLSGGKKQKLIEKLEQAKKTMVQVMYQQKEWKGMTNNIKMLVKKECVCNSSVGGKEKKPSRKVSSAVQRKISSQQQQQQQEQIKSEEKNTQKQTEKVVETKQQKEEIKIENKQQEKKYVLTKIEPQEDKNKPNKEDIKKIEKKDNFKQPRKVTFDQIKEEKTDGFIEVKTRSQIKQENNNSKFERKRMGQKFQKKKDYNRDRERPPIAKKQQQVVQYVKKEQSKEE